MCTIRRFTAALLALIVTPVALAASTTLTDGTFSNADWSVAGSSNVSGVAGGQVGAGGNPGSYWNVSVTGFSSGGNVVSLSTALTFDPPTSGFINSIGYSLNRQRFTPAPNPPNLPNPSDSHWLAIRQGGCIYQALAGFAGQVVTGWRTGTIFPLTASQFGLVSGGGCAVNPDFSVTAPTLEFGLNDRYNGTSGAVSAGSDNLSITISFQPEILSVSTDSINHGFVLVGTTSTLPLTVINSGATVSALSGNFPAVASPNGPTSALAYGPLAGGGTALRNYTFAPTVRGAAVSVADVTSNAGNETIVFGGTGVAPVNSVDTSQRDAGFVRLGTTGLARVVVTNIGNGNLSGAGAASNLNGTITVLSGPEFTGPSPGSSLSLSDGAGATVDYDYDPQNRLVDTVGITLAFSNGSDDEQNNAQNVAVQLAGNGVGPVFDSLPAPGATLDFGETITGQVISLPLSVDNTSTDPDGGNATLTNLSVDAVLGGPHAGAWQISGLPNVVARGGSTTLQVSFVPNVEEQQTLNATLTLITDEGTPFSDLSGSSFRYDLTGLALPPPVIPTLDRWGLVLLGLLLGGLTAWRLRRRTARQDKKAR